MLKLMCVTSFPKRQVGYVMRDMQRPPSLGLVNTKCNIAAGLVRQRYDVLCDPSRSGYAIAHAVCVCATPVRNRNHAEPASIGEPIFIKMSPPFG